MKIVARIEKLAGDRYLLEGEIFDSSLRARREMVQRMRLRRIERRTRGTRDLSTSLECGSLLPPSLGRTCSARQGAPLCGTRSREHRGQVNLGIGTVNLRPNLPFLRQSRQTLAL